MRELRKLTLVDVTLVDGQPVGKEEPVAEQLLDEPVPRLGLRHAGVVEGHQGRVHHGHLVGEQGAQLVEESLLVLEEVSLPSNIFLVIQYILLNFFFDTIL